MYESKKDKQISDIYNRLLERLKEEIDPNLFAMLFDEESFSLKSIEGDKAIFLCEVGSTATIISNSYSSLIEKILSELLETPIEIEILDKKSYVKKQDYIDNATSSFFKNCRLQKQYTFDSFVIGPSNRSAYAAALYAVNNPAISNPIFLYSNSGLGKTHLLQAIGNEYAQRHPESKVLYITSDDFLNEYVKYIKGRKADELRDFFNTVDMLLVDDIQFLAGKNDTQTMFFNVFNLLVSHGKQIVLTSDRAPSELKDLPDRLISRFKGGLTITINSPSIDTLIDILKMKIKINGLDLKAFDDEVLSYLAKNYSNNVRELEGALTTLIFSITTMDHPSVIDLNFVKEVFQSDEEKRNSAGKVDVDSLLDTVSRYYKITTNELVGKCKTGQIALARQIAMYLARDVLNMTYANIGKYFKKDHSTVVSNCKKVTALIEKDENVKKAITKIKAILLCKN